MANTLFLRLEGPVQSWGERARWSVRDTAPEPTKSGVVGLLCCALGWMEDEPIRQLSQNLRMGVRCDHPGVRMVDYHTIVGGVLSAEGKIKINANTKMPETVVTHRAYLWDASFWVALQASPEVIHRLKEAVQNPVFPLYLGRKSCPPACPVYAGMGDFPDLQTALSYGLSPESGSVRAVLECLPGEGSQRQDEILSHCWRTFLPRYTREMMLSAPRVPGRDEPCTSLD